MRTSGNHTDGGGIPLSEPEIRVAFEALTGLPARTADVQAVQLLGADTANLAEYVWGHWMGEPDEVDPGELQQHLEAHIEEIRRVAKEEPERETES